MIEVPSNPEPASPSDLAGLVDSFRRPEGDPHASGWLPFTAPLPKWVEREVDAVARDFQRPSGQTFFRFRKPAPAALLVSGGKPDEEAAVVDRLAKQLDLRIFFYDLQDLRRMTLPELVPMLAPLYDGRTAVIHLGRIDKFSPDQFEALLEGRSDCALIVATARARDLPAAKHFKRKIAFEH
jgi:hypothetical protein